MSVHAKNTSTPTAALHKPWTGSKGGVTERHALRLLAVALLTGLALTLSLYTLRVVEPVRATLLEHLDVAIVPALGYLVGRHRKVTVARSAGLAIVAALLVVWYDPQASAEYYYSTTAGAGLKVLPGQQVAPDAFGGVVPLPLPGSGGWGDSGSGALVTPLPASHVDTAAGEDTGAANGEAPNIGGADSGTASVVKSGTAANAGDDSSHTGAGSGSDASDPPLPQPVPPQAPPLPAEDAAVGGAETFSKGRRMLLENAAMPSRPLPPSAKSASPSAEARLSRYPRDAAKKVLKQAQKVRAVMEKHSKSSVVLAALFMGLAAWCNTVRRRLEKSLAVDTGLGSKRMHATVLATAAIVWAPIAWIRWMASGPTYAPGSEFAAVDEAVASLANGAAVVDDVSMATADAMLAHAGPNFFIYLVVAGLYGCVVLVLADYAVDLPLTGGSKAAIVQVLSGGGAPGSASASVAAPVLGGVGGGGLPSIGGSGKASSAASGSASASPDQSLMRVFSMIATFAFSIVLSKLFGWGYQTTWMLWIGGFLYLPGIIGAAGLDASQLSRLYNIVTRGSSGELFSSTSSASNDGMDGGAGGIASVFLSLVSVFTGGGQTYSAESGGMVTAAYSSTSVSSGWHGFKKVMRHIWEDPNSKKIFLFLSINVSAERSTNIATRWALCAASLVRNHVSCSFLSHLDLTRLVCPTALAAVFVHVRRDIRGMDDQQPGTHLRRRWVTSVVTTQRCSPLCWCKTCCSYCSLCNCARTPLAPCIPTTPHLPFSSPLPPPFLRSLCRPHVL